MVAIVLLSLTLNALAYEQVTHGAMTREAMMQSQLNPTTPDLLQRLGIADRQVSLGQFYVDVDATGNAIIRAADPPDAGGCLQAPPSFGPTLIARANKLSAFQPTSDSLPGWLMLGAIREDDVPCSSFTRENNPSDEQGGPFVRVNSHFYDPYNDQPLTIGIDPYGAKTPDWATQSTNFMIAIAQPFFPPVYAPQSNHFSTPLAREAMWRALTLKSSPAQGMADLPLPDGTDIPTKEALRVAYWATTFRALGDVVHLLQDMAQPQHTRNDPHSGVLCVSSFCPYGHASYYEKYVDLLVTGEPLYKFEGGFLRETLPALYVPNKPAPAYSGYPVPSFNDFRSFFVTATGSGSATGYGMANYSNQGFYSAGTNIDNNFYPLPSVGLLTASPPPKNQVQDAAGVNVPGTLTLFTGTVVDSLNANLSVPAVALSSYGMFDQFLQPAKKDQFTLNHYNYDAQVALNIPRAVAYSAGLLNYFFRGSMDISLPKEGVYSIVDHSQFEPPATPTLDLLGFVGFNQIRLNLTNSTPPLTLTVGNTMVPQPMSSGTLVAVLRFHRDLCYSDSLDLEMDDPQQLSLCRSKQEEIVVSNPVAITGQAPSDVPMSPGSREFTFTFADNNNLPINAWDVVLQVVYRGQLGGEADAVVVATKYISEPTFLTVFNDTDNNIYVGGSCYNQATVVETDALWNQLTASCKPTAGAERYITTTCINVPLSISLTPATATDPVTVAWPYSTAQDARLSPGRFGRFAVLTDIVSTTDGGTTSMTIGFNNGVLTLGAGQQTQNFLNYQAAQQNVVTFTDDTYQTATFSVADTYVRHRGVNTWQGVNFVVDGTTAAVNGTCPDSQLTTLAGPAHYPQPATITLP